MQDINYDLVQLLHETLDIIWQLEKFCIHDSTEAKCHSLPALQEILKDEKRHAEMIAKEIQMRIEAKVFV